PTAGAITYGSTLGTSVLTGGTVSAPGVANLPGTFTFTNSNAILGAGTSSQQVTFTPTDSVNYNTVTGNVNITVNKKALSIAGTNQTKTYGSTFPFTGSEFTAPGLVNGDTATSATLTSPGTAATAVIGSYTITPTAVAPASLSNNYTITF